MKLTPAEREVVNLLGRGLTTKEIARELGKSRATVRNQIHNARARTGVRSSIELAVLAAKDGADPG